jgi:hypothetical protein
LNTLPEDVLWQLECFEIQISTFEAKGLKVYKLFKLCSPQGMGGKGYVVQILASFMPGKEKKGYKSH